MIIKFNNFTPCLANDKPGLDRKIDLKAILDEDSLNGSSKHVAQIAGRIASLLRTSLPESWLHDTEAEFDHDLLGIVLSLEGLESISSGNDEGTVVLDSLNERLVRLYAWADTKQILIEG